MQEVLPLLTPNLSSRSQAMRQESLRVLTAFSQPLIQRGEDAQEEVPSNLFSVVLRIETQQAAVGTSRSAPAAIESLQTMFEFNKVPPLLVRPAIQCLLGFLNMRYALSFQKQLAMAF